MPTQGLQPSVRFVELPPGAVFSIDFKLQARLAPGNAQLCEVTSDPVELVALEGSVSVPVGLGCDGKMRIPITGQAPVGVVTYSVKAGGQVIRSKKHDLAGLGLGAGDIYICRCHGEPA